MTYVLHYAPDNASLIVRLALLELDQPFRTCSLTAAPASRTAPPTGGSIPPG